MRVAIGLLALAASALQASAEDEPEVPPLGTCKEIRESPLPDDDDFFNFKQVPSFRRSERLPRRSSNPSRGIILTWTMSSNVVLLCSRFAPRPCCVSRLNAHSRPQIRSAWVLFSCNCMSPQHDERLDPNKFLRVVFHIMSQRSDDPIKKVQVDFNPILHHITGPYKMRATVSHQKGDAVVDSCYDLVIQIHDTDECAQEGGKEWHHTCDASTTCVNTQGGYYCACPENSWAVQGSGNNKCDGNSDSTECCGIVTYDGAPHGDFGCRGDFKCHSDSCAFNDCHADAECIPGSSPNTFSCACKTGFRDVGVDKSMPGRVCAAMDHCAAPHPCPTGCDCSSVVNPETDGYFCTPKAGYATYYPNEEYEWVTKPAADPYRLDDKPHLCAIQTAPDLALLGDTHMVLTQGQK